MHDPIAHEKCELRRTTRAARCALSPEDRARTSQMISKRALELPELAAARAVLVYSASAEEVDPAPLERALRARGVAIAYPRVAGARTLELHWVDDPSALVSGAFGLREPATDAPSASLAELDVIIVPGVAFDAACNRIGYGGGFYDALLADVPHTPPTIGLAFEEQMLPKVPCEEFDRALDVVVTPQRILRH